jgi:excisionase family DNA binding protein
MSRYGLLRVVATCCNVLLRMAMFMIFCDTWPSSCLDEEGENMDSTTERLLTPGEVAALFRVDPKTVTRWAASGRISSIRTPGGHRRFRESEVRELLGEPASEAR